MCETVSTTIPRVVTPGGYDDGAGGLRDLPGVTAEPEGEEVQ